MLPCRSVRVPQIIAVHVYPSVRLTRAVQDAELAFIVEISHGSMSDVVTGVRQAW